MRVVACPDCGRAVLYRQLRDHSAGCSEGGAAPTIPPGGRAAPRSGPPAPAKPVHINATSRSLQ